MKNEDYLVHNLQVIGENLKFINWNLGKITAVLTKDKKLFQDIVEAENENED